MGCTECAHGSVGSRGARLLEMGHHHRAGFQCTWPASEARTIVRRGANDTITHQREPNVLVDAVRDDDNTLEQVKDNRRAHRIVYVSAHVHAAEVYLETRTTA